MIKKEKGSQYQPLPGCNASLEPQLWLVFYHNELVMDDQGSVLWRNKPEFISDEHLVTGYWQGQAVALVDTVTLPSGLGSVSLRALLTALDPDLFLLLSHGAQLRESRRSHRYCGRCGRPCKPAAGEWAMVCTGCQHPVYPRISPCIIVLVYRDDEFLLVRHRRHGQDSAMHTVIAGFIEPGETAEDAVHREVMEEVGIRLASVKYQFSQSWPFPHSLMLGFHAEYASGHLMLDEKELSSGGWFKRSKLPELPPLFTISRQLIDSL